MIFSDITVTSCYLTFHSPSFVFPFLIPPSKRALLTSSWLSHTYPGITPLCCSSTKPHPPIHSQSSLFSGFFSYTRTSEDLGLGASDETEHVMFVLSESGLLLSMWSFLPNDILLNELYVIEEIKEEVKMITRIKLKLIYRLPEPLEYRQGHPKKESIYIFVFTQRTREF